MYCPQCSRSSLRNDRFLKDLNITFRRDPTNHRPRINKLNSVKDKEQKAAGTYFYLDTDDEVDETKKEQKQDKQEKKKKPEKKEK